MRPLSYANRANMEFIENLYQDYQKDPASVSVEWQRFFEGVEFTQLLVAPISKSSQVSQSDKGVSRAGDMVSEKELNVFNLIYAYREYGHFEAQLDPLNLQKRLHDILELKNYNLSEQDLDSTFSIGALVGKPGGTLREIIEHLKRSYCGTITCQIADTVPKVREWFEREFEKSNFSLSQEDQKNIYHQLVRTETLEKFIHSRFLGAKRFSIEGADSMISMLEWLAQKGGTLKIEEIVIGMAHRGRINVLTNFMDKALKVVLAEFDGQYTVDERDFDGDVKYHLGYSKDKVTPTGPMHLSLAFNPSHLEAVNPVVIGMVRAKQRLRNDSQKREKVVPVLIHGDAAFAGQGVVAETLQMAQLKGYTVGGTIHLVVDNQVGFTTDPKDDRSSPYCTDMAKSQQLPVMHVNGDDVESCVRAMDIAMRFRQEFKSDVVVNIVCYRRFGHNETDEPAFTQPVMYEVIKQHPTLRNIYGQNLIAKNVIDSKTFEDLYTERMDNLQKVLEEVRLAPPVIKPPAFGGFWQGLRRPRAEDFEKQVDTSVPVETLKYVTQILTTVPPNFTVHPKLQRLLDARREMVEKTDHIDWGMAELLAYGSVIAEGNDVRLSGQDCIRGTFSHRHSGFFDFHTNELYIPLSQVKAGTDFHVYNSFLSEMAVLGFEYGNSSSDPTFLTIWEAQFGDFANGAQIIIDQFLASGEQKWLRMSGLVLLLPHGYEGQGPEHSSARLERFLQLCGQGNMQVVNVTTPAQIFHVMRRQIRREFRVPLVVMSPKSLLRNPKVVSHLSELADGHFKEVIGQEAVGNVQDMDNKIERVILVSGKLFYELQEKQESLGDKGKTVAIIRIEQLYPYPNALIQKELKRYKNLKSVIWAQEEPKNMGSWHFIAQRLQDTFNQIGLKASLRYAGRSYRASPAVGSIKVHGVEQKEIIESCFQD